MAILADRNVMTLVGYFAAMEAGGFAMPLDPKMPDARLRRILERISPAAILCRAADESSARALDAGPVLCLEESMENQPDPALLAGARERVIDLDPAYLIMTSGSTGEPKGIPVSHRSIIDFTEWMAEYCGVTEDDVLGNQAPFFFDLSLKDVFQTVRNGATCRILPKRCFLFPKLLISELREHHVTCLVWATSAFRMTAESGIFEVEAPECVSKVILGGEALQAKHLNRWRRAIPACRFINLYGPTEVTVDCTAYRIERTFEDQEKIPIGRACRNMEILLLDEELRPVKEGEAGEICVRGAGLALGYYGDPGRTAEAFIQNPLNPDWHDRLYRTGDIGKIGPDGELYYLSRKDGQIKHGGYRIELGEIETAISAIRDVRAAVCFFDAENDRIVAAAETSLTAAELDEEVGNIVPKYMKPGAWRVYSRLPMTPNGKIDRTAVREQYFHEQN